MSGENHEKLLKKELPKLPFAFRERLKKRAKWQDVQLSVLGMSLLFTAVKKQYHLNLDAHDILYNQYNKPYFKGNPVYFNISHSAEIAVCAITDKTQLGIDIEKIYQIELGNFKGNMSDCQWNDIVFSNNAQEAFFDYWTQKEAVIKAAEKGLNINLQSFEILEKSASVEKEIYFLEEIKIDKSYKCYLAHKIKGKTCLKSIEIKLI
ncbi:4'-phosphopantetheinyl transferase family protein [Flavobacterium chilense]|uniref:4'-phosphopantetheinyl transferase family protein n=1 Tax=Flavobacterium chilense TaxID=946677 RepID=UPI001FD80D73|nr:4'-phosphopantetheinyl transferase superfamily protein [Flavobacterium chilense]